MYSAPCLFVCCPALLMRPDTSPIIAEVLQMSTSGAKNIQSNFCVIDKKLTSLLGGIMGEDYLKLKEKLHEECI